MLSHHENRKTNMYVCKSERKDSHFTFFLQSSTFSQHLKWIPVNLTECELCGKIRAECFLLPHHSFVLVTRAQFFASQLQTAEQVCLLGQFGCVAHLVSSHLMEATEMTPFENCLCRTTNCNLTHLLTKMTREQKIWHKCGENCLKRVLECLYSNI